MKFLASLILLFGFGSLGVRLWIFSMSTMSQQFYGIYIPLVTIGFIIISILLIYEKWKIRAVKIGSIAFLVIASITVGSYEGYQYYLRSLEIVSTQDVDLTAYQPFTEDTQAVALDEDSTLRIEENLPRLDGATALYPVYSSFAQAVYPEKEYHISNSEVISSQTSGAFNNLIYGSADIAFLAEPSEEQYEKAEKRNVELFLTPIGREAFVFFVHHSNPVESLTVEEIQAIYSGEITNWKEVGGKDKEIVAFQRPEGSGSQSALIRFMDGKSLMDPPADEIVTGMAGIIRETSNYRNQRNAIGYSFRYFSQEMVENGEIKHVAVDDVAPTKENIQNNSYPVVAEFYAITAGSDNPNVPLFVEWMQSQQGQSLVDQTGYVSLP
ncbi:phosphate transport system substrate-binding protein [Gracilibacillus orientalis]|uniref:Phosphate transport system substrate-binding protein n=1 Tax=Gracilibacillus orientalis TaxID=334253 RepID=A0A1I4MH07_9BACI|nr:substrate-binding domain-containing protein [Gracilibacillus orientalis]SFM02541.1 phosphate transport system substrate-binding protein [Gracilibacillus orientalis]